jgi:peptide/nickel transport system substrate-binding protein
MTGDRRHRVALWLRIAVLVVLSLPGCAREAPRDPSIITAAIASSPNNLDPRIGTDEVSQKLQQLIFDPLFRIEDHLQVVPHLATGWDTPDDRTYVVHLRHGVLFHDGHELTSADVRYTFASFLDPAFVSPRKGAYRMLAGVDALGRYTVRFRLNEPFGSFPVNLVMSIVPDGWAGRGPERPIGTGPYRFVSEATDDRVVLKAFGQYSLGAPRNAGLVLKVMPDDIMRGLEFRKGSIDLVVNDLAPDIIDQMQKDPDLQVVRSPGTDYEYLGFNLRDPILHDVRVRHAIGYAIDREAIVRYLLRGLAIPAIGILPPASWAFKKVNVAVARSTLTGIALSPSADFTFLTDVSRRSALAAGSPDAGHASR